MDFKRCPECSGVLQPGAPHTCAHTKDFEIETSQICPACGQSFQGASHANCSRARTRVPSRPPRDDTPEEVTTALQNPDNTMHQYVLVSRLGRGGMGEVWKAWDKSLTRWVAIKFLTLAHEDALRRFQREAKLAARLRHPNIAPVYEVGEHHQRHYLAMDFVDGMTLEHAKLPLRMKVDLIAKVARALDSAHRSGVIHRDIKPANIMITRENWPYLMDFGLARSVEVDASISVTGDIVGTPIYMPPEQALGRPSELDARSDVYSLGATLYTLLTGRHPYAGETPMDILLQVVQGDLTPPTKLHPEIPRTLEAVVLKAMAKAKSDRYSTATDFANDLERFLADEAVHAKPPSVIQQVARGVRRNPWPVAVAMLAIAASVAIVWALRKKPMSPTAPLDTPARMREDAWRAEARKMAYPDYAGEPVDLSKAPPHELREEVRDYLTMAQKEVERWSAPRLLENVPKARKLERWCLAAEGALRGRLDDVVQEIAAIRASAQPILAYGGTCTIQVMVGPYATVIVRRGNEVILTEVTPAARFTLDVDAYVFEFQHPQYGPKRIDVKGLEDGRTYLVHGDLRDGSIRLLGR